jgi:NADH-quinone oxidoreductase subunit H
MVEALIMLAKVLGAQLFVIAVVVPVMIWSERRFIARLQQRYGPNRAGPFGLLQPFADFVKLVMKENVSPDVADRGIYNLAPLMAGVPAFLGMIVIPYSVGENGYAARLPVSVLLVLGLSSLQVYGVFLAGWSSRTKYPLLGALRASAQMISYELTLSCCVLIAVLMAGSLDLVQIVESQRGSILCWHVFWYFPLGLIPFVLMVIAMLAESNRCPFDLPEAESELVAGFHTEFSSMKFAVFFMAEYAAMWNMSALTVTLFLGGWSGPGVEAMCERMPTAGFLLGCLYFIVKCAAFMVLFLWVRATLPRLRYDQLMDFGWKRLLPVALGMVGLIIAAMLFLG